MSELEQQITVLRKRQRKLLGVIVAILLLFYFGVFRTANGQLNRIVNQVRAVDNELALNQQQVEALPRIAADVQRLRNDLSRTRRELPDEPGYSQFWGDASRLAQTLSLRNSQFQQQAPETINIDSESSIGVMPVRITFEGDFASGFAFLRQIESYPRLLHVRKTSVKSVGITGDTAFELWVNLYYRTEPTG
ncbi:MAG: type 4a pilus biogenesis protein PilO [Planctomycetota bacterium]